MHDEATLSGWLPSAGEAWIVLAAWVAAVLLYGLWRSRGEAKPDPIRPSGPTGAGASGRN